MTATEAMLRAQEKGQLLAPTAGRIQAEFLGTLILREIDIAYQNGLLPEPPEQLKEIGGEYDIEYTSPLVRLQMSEEASGIMNVVNAAGTIGQFDQNIARTLNGDAALRFIAKASGAPLQVVKTEDEMAAQDAADQQQLQLQQLLAAAPVAATAAKDFAQANQIAQTPARRQRYRDNDEPYKKSVAHAEPCAGFPVSLWHPGEHDAGTESCYPTIGKTLPR